MPFAVHVRVEELADVRLELPDGLDRRDRQRRPPAVDHDPAAAAVDRGDDPVGADGLRERAGDIDLHAGGVEERRADDHVGGAGLEHALGALDRADAAADAAGQTRADLAHEIVVRPFTLGGVEVDELDLAAPFEAADPGVEIVALDGELLTLDELHDAAALEVDGRNEHGRVR